MQFLASSGNKLALHRFIRLRQRYFLTRQGKVRARYIFGAATFGCAALLALGTSLSAVSLRFSKDSAFDVAEYTDTEAARALASLSPEAGAMNAQMSEILQNGVSDGIRKASASIKKAEKPRFREVKMGSGDTVAGLLQNAGLDDSDTYYAIKALGKYLDVRKVQSGQKIDLHFRPDGAGDLKLSKMEMKLDPTKEVRVVRKGPEAFVAEVEEKELHARTYARKAKIQTSLYGSAARASIPSSIVAELIRVYSWNIDFQRDIQPGDTLEVMYEMNETEDGEYARSGDVLYAKLNIGGKDIPIYRYEASDGHVDYFGLDGMSIRKTLLKTPVDGARISSGFGMRRHPVLGYTKMHKGMDFAAPTGTPVYAAGDGTVEYASRFSSFGNYVRIRHNNKMKTAYAHLHRIKGGVAVGTHVRQGQIIGYVGTTGRSTGPHLHYEIMVNNKQVNPKSVDLPTGQQLGGKDLKRFKSMVGRIRQQYAEADTGTRLAQNVTSNNDSSLR